jgi:hypothetical protein
VPGSTLSLAATGTTSSTQLLSNEDDLTWDVGLYRVLSLGDYVWHDTDNDRTQDGGEPGIANVTVWLYRDVDGSNDFNILHRHLRGQYNHRQQWDLHLHQPDLGHLPAGHSRQQLRQRQRTGVLP